MLGYPEYMEINNEEREGRLDRDEQREPPQKFRRFPPARLLQRIRTLNVGRGTTNGGGQ